MVTFPAHLTKNDHSNPEEKPVNPPNSPEEKSQQHKQRRHQEPMDKVLSKLQVGTSL